MTTVHCGWHTSRLLLFNSRPNLTTMSLNGADYFPPLFFLSPPRHLLRLGLQQKKKNTHTDTHRSGPFQRFIVEDYQALPSRGAFPLKHSYGSELHRSLLMYAELSWYLVAADQALILQCNSMLRGSRESERERPEEHIWRGSTVCGCKQSENHIF